jgi:hypothetical protein
MKYCLVATLSCLFFLFVQDTYCQVDDSQLGAWYMYMWNKKIPDSQWGVEGEVQYTDYEIAGDQEWLLLRAAVTYKPKNPNLSFAFGYGHLTFGEIGPEHNPINENRIYPQLKMKQKVSERISFTHRFRFELRFIEGVDFRSRFRYGLFTNIPLNNTQLDKNTWYIGLYNELFLNGERQIGNGREVQYFDQNRSYAAIGYCVSDKIRVELGFMRRIAPNRDSNLLQLTMVQAW